LIHKQNFIQVNVKYGGQHVPGSPFGMNSGLGADVHTSPDGTGMQGGDKLKGMAFVFLL